MITPERLFVRNFEPGLSRLNWSGYKEASYPGMPLLRVLHAAGRLEGRAAEWLQPGRAEFELYDLRSDPAGLGNVAAEPARQDALARHRQVLDDWITASADRGGLPDPATEPSLPEIQRAKRADYQRTWQARLKKPEPTDAERLGWWESAYGLRPR